MVNVLIFDQFGDQTFVQNPYETRASGFDQYVMPLLNTGVGAAIGGLTGGFGGALMSGIGDFFNHQSHRKVIQSTTCRSRFAIGTMKAILYWRRYSNISLLK